ncbi:hypothetical protein LTR17_019751 [Elasticomyces elasticus]|nr:hypothetical protein LTR17_019751 [Elasticomyces elasticus]
MSMDYWPEELLLYVEDIGIFSGFASNLASNFSGNLASSLASNASTTSRYLAALATPAFFAHVQVVDLLLYYLLLYLEDDGGIREIIQSATMLPISQDERQGYGQMARLEEKQQLWGREGWQETVSQSIARSHEKRDAAEGS